MPRKKWGLCHLLVLPHFCQLTQQNLLIRQRLHSVVPNIFLKREQRTFLILSLFIKLAPNFFKFKIVIYSFHYRGIFSKLIQAGGGGGIKWHLRESKIRGVLKWKINIGRWMLGNGICMGNNAVIWIGGFRGYLSSDWHVRLLSYSVLFLSLSSSGPITSQSVV